MIEENSPRRLAIAFRVASPGSVVTLAVGPTGRVAALDLNRAFIMTMVMRVHRDQTSAGRGVETNSPRRPIIAFRVASPGSVLTLATGSTGRVAALNLNRTFIMTMVMRVHRNMHDQTSAGRGIETNSPSRPIIAFRVASHGSLVTLAVGSSGRVAALNLNRAFMMTMITRLHRTRTQYAMAVAIMIAMREIVPDSSLHVRVRPATGGKKSAMTTHATGTESATGKTAKHARAIEEMVTGGRILMI